MDLTDTIIPRSDQLNAEDLLTGPRTFTVTEVRKGSAEQPVDIHLAEFPGRPFKPSKTVRRILVSAWGPDAATYAGRRMTLYRDPAVRFGGMDVGGIRVSHLSHIAKPMTLVLAVSKGKRAPYVVKPLADEPAKTPEQYVAEAHKKMRDAGEDPNRPVYAAAAKPDSDSITPAQLTALNAALSQDLGFTERDDKLAWLSAELGREIGSSKDVTKAEAGRLLDGFSAAMAETEPTLPDGAA